MFQTLLVGRPQASKYCKSAWCLVNSGPLTRKTPSRHLPNEFFSFGRNHLSGIVSGRDRWYKSRGTVIIERLIQMCAFFMWLVFIEQNFSKLHYTHLKFNPSGNLVFDFVIQSLHLFVIWILMILKGFLTPKKRQIKWSKVCGHIMRVVESEWQYRSSKVRLAQGNVHFPNEPIHFKSLCIHK